MIFATILSSIFSIYPWNVGGSIYMTEGYYSNDYASSSKAIYLSMDRRQKDGFVIGYEELVIEMDDEPYRQFNWVGRDVFWIKPSLRFAGLVGHLSSENSDDAWLAGVQAEGDLPWFGYSSSYIRSDYQLWIPYALRDAWENIVIDQSDLHLSRKIGPFIGRIGVLHQQIGENNYSSTQYSISSHYKEKVTASISYSDGESLYAVDPYVLVINNNPDILKTSTTLRCTYKLNPNIYFTGIWSSQSYEPYDIQYLSIGITGRF